ncbi:hypothetical protein [Hathewaya massiliensis]|uniref:hypothetical protein n=1 Tax=Hathewaya massiliensis TaxID=1964382 RepID=UPI0011589B21|nr:hypothetical protein [Hathewaya massiliensis]
MGTYKVSIPFTGIACIEVEAENEKEAIKEGFEKVDFDRDCEEIEFHTKVVEGNVFYGLLDEAYAERKVE